jgi:hypothetical protein
MAEVAREALLLMHYEEPFDREPMKETADACVAGCYRCLLSYFVTAQVRLDSFRQTTVQNFLDSGF